MQSFLRDTDPSLMMRPFLTSKTLGTAQTLSTSNTSWREKVKIQGEIMEQEGKACMAARGSHNLSKTLVTPESVGDTNLIFKNALIVEIKGIPEGFTQHDKPEKPG